jgi:hypothetical protein
VACYVVSKFGVKILLFSGLTGTCGAYSIIYWVLTATDSYVYLVLAAHLFKLEGLGGF